MLDNDNIISTSISEAVEKIPTDVKDYRKCFFMCFTLHSHSIQRVDQHIPIVEIVVRKRCNNWHMISFIHCGSEKRVYRHRFPGCNQLADAREGVG